MEVFVCACGRLVLSLIRFSSSYLPKATKMAVLYAQKTKKVLVKIMPQIFRENRIYFLGKT